MNDALRIFACNSNRPLAEEICGRLGMRLSPLDISRFSNDNLRVQVLDNVRERDVFVIQSFTSRQRTHHGVADHARRFEKRLGRAASPR